MNIIVKNNNILIFDDFKFKCCVGINGVSKHKKEGDNKTPKGVFKLGNVYFRKDRTKKIETKLNILTIKKNMGWCDDIKSSKYNKLVKTNSKFSHEKLFRNSSNYDLLIPIQYNTTNPKKGKGSAIFLHLTKNFKRTLGCIALKKKDMLILLKLINKKTKIKII